MLARARALPSSRLAAALVAVSLSGMPGVVTRAVATPGVECTCPSHRGKHTHDHPCECASRHATGAPAQRAPPCHGSAGGQAGDRAPLSSSCARLAGCGAPLPDAAPPPSMDPFALPEAVPLAPAVTAETVASAIGRPRDVAVQPDTPPPRPA